MLKSGGGGVYAVCEEEISSGGDYGEKTSRVWKLVLPLIRFYGIFTAVVFCGVGIDIAAHNHKIGVFYVICSLIVFFFEVTWVVSLFLQICLSDELHPCYDYWDKILWFRLWKKSVLYTIFALILFIKPTNILLSVMTGFLLLFLAFLYLILTYRSRQKSASTPRMFTSHFTNRRSSFEKYEDMTVMMDDIPRASSSNRLADLDNDTLLEM